MLKFQLRQTCCNELQFQETVRKVKRFSSILRNKSTISRMRMIPTVIITEYIQVNRPFGEMLKSLIL